MNVRIRAEAAEELRNAAAWYSAIDRALSRRFLRAYRDAMRFVRESPLACALVSTEPEIRKWRVHGFPYGILFSYRNDECVILAVAHARRKPGYWSRRAAK